MTDPLAKNIGVVAQGGTVSIQTLNVGIAERQEANRGKVRILVVAANPLEASPLQLDREVKTIQEALKRSRRRDNFVVEYRLAATPLELRRALLDIEPHVLHFSGHGAGKKGLLFVTDNSASALHRSEDGSVRATNAQGVQYVPAEPLANLLKLCKKHLECTVLNACYSDDQGSAISVHVPYTIGMRDAVADHVAIKFSEGFYDALGAGKNYEKSFEWGKSAIEFDLGDVGAAKVLILRKKLSSAMEYFDRALEKQNQGDKQEAIADYDQAIRLKPDYADAYYNRGVAKSDLGKNTEAIADYDQAIRLKPDYADAYYNRGNAKYYLGNKTEAIADYDQAIRLKPDYALAYYNRGNAKSDLGKNTEAIADYDQAIRLKPDYADAYYNRGSAKRALGKNTEAIADYDQAIRLKPDYAHPYYNRGNAKRALGNKTEALADFQKAAQIYQQQGKTSDYQDAQNRIKELGG